MKLSKINEVETIAANRSTCYRTSSMALVMLIVSFFVNISTVNAAADPPTAAERMFEWTIESRKAYGDPFNDVDVDVIFNKDGRTWRVPMFWRGESRWTVRFAPPAAGEYRYHLQSTDHSNPDLNGHEGRVFITPYAGTNALLQRGLVRVSANKRYFE